MYRIAIFITLTSILLLAPSSFAQGASFEPLGNLPAGDLFSAAHGVSADGSVVVGTSSSGPENNQEAFYWTEKDGMVGLGDLPGGPFSSFATNVSAEGSVVVGHSALEDGTEAFIWTEEGGMVGLGTLGGKFTFSVASGVSTDGNVVVGQSSSKDGPEAFIWTEESGMIGLGDFSGGEFYSAVENISDDGNVVVGQGSSEDGTEAFIWTVEDGMVGLGSLPGGDFFYSVAHSTSIDGSTVVGQSSSENDSENGSEAIIWTEEGGMVGLGYLGGMFFYSLAYGVSADGNVVVGESFSENGPVAFIWTEEEGMQNLKEVLENDYDLDLTGWTLMTASDASSDGTVIVGQGINPDGNGEAWRAVIPRTIANEATPETLADVLSAPNPNPASGISTFTIAVEQGQRVVVEAFDVMGRHVQTVYEGTLVGGMSETLTLDVAALPAGVYVIRARGESFAETRRVTIVR